jgi:hypothetical protein
MRPRAWLTAGVVLTACGIEGEELFADGQQPVGDSATSSVAETGAAAGQGGANTESGVGGTFTVSASNATGSSSVASSTVAGGMNESLCLPKSGDTQCTQCVKGTCCGELDACAANATCACVLACTLAKQQNCYSKCNAGFNEPAWSALVGCRTLKCAFDCIGQ